jgi:hypothetical protein
MARWLGDRWCAAIILVAVTATTASCASAASSGTRSGESSDAEQSASALHCVHGTVGFAFDGAGGGGADTAAEAVSRYVAGTRTTDQIARYASRSTKWTIVHDSNGDAETFSAPHVELHVIRLPHGWIVDSGSYCR